MATVLNRKPIAVPSLEGKQIPLKRVLVTTLALSVLLAGSWGGWLLWNDASAHEGTDDAFINAHINPISSKIGGTVQHIYVNDNQRVRAGQLLADLDPGDQKVEVEQAQAEVDHAQRQADASKVSVSQSVLTAQAQQTQAAGDVSGAESVVQASRSALAAAQYDVARAQAQAEQSKARLDNAQTDAGRYKSLVDQGAVSRQQYDQAMTTLRVAQGEFAAAQQSVSQSKARVEQARSQIAQSVAQVTHSQGTVQAVAATREEAKVNQENVKVSLSAVKKAQAALDQAQLRLSYTRVYAPVAGRVGKRSIELGQMIQPGQKLMTIVSEDPWIDANLKETQLGRVAPGQEVQIKIDAFAGKTFKGRIDSIAPASGAEFALLPAENATGNFTKIVQRVPVKIVFEKTSTAGFEDRIVPGMSAEVSVDVR